MTLDSLHLMWDLVRCQTVLQGTSHVKGAEGLPTTAACLALGTENDNGNDFLTPLLRGETNDSSFGNLRAGGPVGEFPE